LLAGFPMLSARRLEPHAPAAHDTQSPPPSVTVCFSCPHGVLTGPESRPRHRESTESRWVRDMALSGAGEATRRGRALGPIVLRDPAPARGRSFTSFRMTTIGLQAHGAIR